jgi:hypothetical protein
MMKLETLKPGKPKFGREPEEYRKEEYVSIEKSSQLTSDKALVETVTYCPQSLLWLRIQKEYRICS